MTKHWSSLGAWMDYFHSSTGVTETTCYVHLNLQDYLRYQEYNCEIAGFITEKNRSGQ